jgi:hypothetical protein
VEEAQQKFEAKVEQDQNESHINQESKEELKQEVSLEDQIILEDKVVEIEPTEEIKEDEVKEAVEVKVDTNPDSSDPLIEEYIDELSQALKASAEEMKEPEDAKDTLTLKQEIEQEKSKMESEKLELADDMAQTLLSEEGIETLSKKKKVMHRNKLKKMFIKRAIQNMDDNLGELEDMGEFDEYEIQKIKDIILKKRTLHKYKGGCMQDLRKYSRDFIGMNTAPMYKNIVNTAQKLLEELEKSLKEEYSEESAILQKLSELSIKFDEESKNARNFNKDKTIDLFNQLAEFFKVHNNGNKITQYELYKSNLIHSLHNFLSLPLIEEESKQSKDTMSSNIDEYNTILCRYLCLIDSFCEENNPKALKILMSTLENTMKISFSNYYSQELLAYHDGLNLAYDLKKYSKRNKLQLVYEPNILKKIEEQEVAEKGQYGYSYNKYNASPNPPVPQCEGEGFEDEEFINHFPEPSLEKFASKREVKATPLVEKSKDLDQAKSTKGEEELVESERSGVFLKRDALYKDLKIVNVSVENSSTVDVIKDFLRNKINCRDHVKQLKAQSNFGSITHTMQSIFDKAKKQMIQNPAEGGNVQSMFHKMVVETLNESGNYEELNEEDKILLVKDIENLIQRMPQDMTPATDSKIY